MSSETDEDQTIAEGRSTAKASPVVAHEVLPPPLGDDASILDNGPPPAGDVLSAPLEAFAADPPDELPPPEITDMAVEDLTPPRPDGSMEVRDPPSVIDTVDLEAPDLDHDDDDPEPSSLVGEILWQDDSAAVRVAFAGGKGGVGRTLLAANVALFLARLGRGVVLVDLDPAGANLHTALGMAPLVPAPGAELRRGPRVRVERLPDMPLRLVRPGRPVLTGAADPVRAEALAAAEELDTDVIILDLGTQADPLTLEAFLGADLPITVTLPSRASIERTHGFLRLALDRRILGGDDRPGLLARALIGADDRDQLGSPPDLVTALAGVEPQAAEAIRARLLSFSPSLVMNRCRSRAERDLLQDLRLVLRRRWGISPQALAAIDNDDAVGDAARRQRPLVLEYPGSAVSGHVERIARQILTRVGRPSLVREGAR